MGLSFLVVVRGDDVFLCTTTDEVRLWIESQVGRVKEMIHMQIRAWQSFVNRNRICILKRFSGSLSKEQK